MREDGADFLTTRFTEPDLRLERRELFFFRRDFRNGDRLLDEFRILIYYLLIRVDNFLFSRLVTKMAFSVTDGLCILLILAFVYIAYCKIYGVSVFRLLRSERFAYENNPAPSSGCNPLGPYKCVQNDYRPEVLTSFGTYATQQCEQSLCKD